MQLPNERPTKAPDSQRMSKDKKDRDGDDGAGGCGPKRQGCTSASAKSRMCGRLPVGRFRWAGGKNEAREHDLRGKRRQGQILDGNERGGRQAGREGRLCQGVKRVKGMYGPVAGYKGTTIGKRRRQEKEERLREYRQGSLLGKGRIPCSHNRKGFRHQLVFSTVYGCMQADGDRWKGV